MNAARLAVIATDANGHQVVAVAVLVKVLVG
jgi:hypothetical protein